MKELLKYTEHLKNLPRTGWLKMGIEHPESVAAHSWQMALLALQLSGVVKVGYDFDKVIKLCLCHDLAESIVGDITPEEPFYAHKEEAEQKAAAQIAMEGNFPELIPLFEEYAAKETPEAKLANDLDKLDVYAHSLYYERLHPEKDLSEFRQTATSKIKTPLGLALLEEIKAK